MCVCNTYKRKKCERAHEILHAAKMQNDLEASNSVCEKVCYRTNQSNKIADN